jgi:hypothetical protein
VINEGLTDEWPPEVIAAASAFQQGDLVERPPLFYVGSGRYGVWRLTRELGDATLTDELFELDPDFCPPYGMITTETCDLTEEDGRPRQPWISIAPVYDATSIMDENMIDLLDRGRLAFLRRVTSEIMPEGVWVVDARIEMPFEKSWLVGRTPIRTCKDEIESGLLAGFLAGRRDRPVLSKALYTGLITPMRRWIENLSAARRAVALDGVSEVRLTIAGSPVDPDGVGLIVLSEKDPVSTPMIQAWDKKWDNWQQRLERESISLLGNAYKSYDSLSAREYRESIQIPLAIAA